MMNTADLTLDKNNNIKNEIKRNIEKNMTSQSINENTKILIAVTIAIL